MIADARVDIWSQVTQFANANYMIILNPISVKVDVGYEHNDEYVGGEEHGECHRYHHGRHPMLGRSVGRRVVPTVWSFPPRQPNVSFCKNTKCCVLLFFRLIRKGKGQHMHLMCPSNMSVCLTGSRTRSHICDHLDNKPPCKLAISCNLAI